MTFRSWVVDTMKYDMDLTLDTGCSHAFDKLRRRALPRRVHKDHVCAFTSRSGFADPPGGICGKEAGVLHAIVLCIAYGIVHRFAVHLHAHYLLCMVGGGQTDGANAAVGIQHHLLAGQLRSLHRKVVQHFGLGVVDLIKAARADGIGLAACLLYTSPSPRDS